MIELVGMTETRMWRIRWRQPIGCGHTEGTAKGQRRQIKRKIEVVQIPRIIYDSTERLSKNNFAVPRNQPLLKKCTHCLMCTWFVSCLVNLRAAELLEWHRFTQRRTALLSCCRLAPVSTPCQKMQSNGSPYGCLHCFTTCVYNPG